MSRTVVIMAAAYLIVACSKAETLPPVVESPVLAQTATPNLLPLDHEPTRETGEFRYSAANGSHRAKLMMTAKVFVESEHALTFADEKYLKAHEYTWNPGQLPRVVSKIDGLHQWYGTDIDVPRREI